MPANWATLPGRWECKYQHAERVRCKRCQMREMVYGDRRASRHGGIASMANVKARAAWWSNTWHHQDDFREHRAVAVERVQAGMVARWPEVLAICGPREWIAPRCWQRLADDPVRLKRLLACAEAFAFERAGPRWGGIAGGVAHTDSGMLSAVARAWIVQAGLERAVLFPRLSYGRLRKMVPLLLEPAQPWLVRYSWRAAREWERLRVKAAKAREAQLAAIRAAEQKSVEQPPP